MFAFYAGLAMGCSFGALVAYQVCCERIAELKYEIQIERWQRERSNREKECRFFRRSLN